MTPTTAIEERRIVVCDDCGNEFPDDRTSCPHCGRPSRFPNVQAATREQERKKLKNRYQQAKQAAKERGCSQAFEEFEAACSKSSAVFACGIRKLHRQIATGTDIFETYYDLDALRVQASVPGDFDWAKLRPQTEIELLGSQRNIEKLHYACLTLDGRGLNHYGECTVQLSEPMIAHRASCFEGNSAVLYKQCKSLADFVRSDWGQRGTLCATSRSEGITKEATHDGFASILVSPGENAVEDQFVEVHVFGPMTAKTLTSVTFDTTRLNRRENTLVDITAEILVSSSIQVHRIA